MMLPDMFAVATPPEHCDLELDPNSGPGCVYSALTIAACETWRLRDDMTVLGARMFLGRNAKTISQDTLSRQLRGRASGSELGAKLIGSGWRVLAHRGRVCLCRDEQRDEMRARMDCADRKSEREESA